MSENKPVVGVTPYMHDDGSRYVPEGYLNGIIETGCEPYVIDYMTVKTEELPAIVEKLDAMLFSGGVDVDPHVYGEEDWPEAGSHVKERDEIEAALARMLINTDMPVLGICRGLQIVNAALGGSLVQHVPKVYGDAYKHQQHDGDPTFVHPVNVKSASRVAEIFGHRIYGGQLPSSVLQDARARSDRYGAGARRRCGGHGDGGRKILRAAAVAS